MKKIILSTLFLFIGFIFYAQENASDDKKFMKTNHFESGFIVPSKKKVSTLILTDGSELRGYCEKVKFSKNHIQHIRFKDSVSGTTHELSASQIKEAYLYPSKAGKFSNVSKLATRIPTHRASKKLIGDESIFIMENVGIKNKKKQGQYLLQLINPGVNDVISVYFDPTAKETKGANIGGLGGSALSGAMTIGGGVLLSYYIKKGDRIIWLPKKNLKKEYASLFGDNTEFMEMYPYKSSSWKNLSALIMTYNKMSENKLSSN